MSKKINIPLKNIRHYLHDLFHEHLDEMYDLERTKRRNRRENIYDYMDDDEILMLMQQGYIFPGLNDDDGCYYDDDDDEDDPNLVWPIIPKKEKKGKNKRNDDDAYAQYWENEEKKAKKKHKKGKNARVININDPYSGDEENPTEYASYEDLESDGINDGKLIYFYPNYRNKEDRLEFNTLREFDDFCADYGYVVPPYVGEQIAYRRISHVCLRPDAREYGMFEIMAEESYADMMYEACDVTELSQ